jgi:uncharacterized protein YjbI with pentapeptide repeats
VCTGLAKLVFCGVRNFRAFSSGKRNPAAKPNSSLTDSNAKHLEVIITSTTMNIIHKIRDFTDSLRLIQRDVSILGVDYFVIKYRYLRELLVQSKALRYLRRVVVILLVLVVLFFIGKWLYSQPWSGFRIAQSTTNNSLSIKTLWDWMELLLIPLALAGIAFLFRKSEVELSIQQSREKSRDDALSLYFQHIQTILLETDLSDSQTAKATSKLVSARTISLLRMLDPERKLLVLRFLHDAELIYGTQPFVNLIRADLRHIPSYRFYLSNANLHGVNLEYAHLQSAQLDGTHLSGANLYRADLSSSYINEANLEYTMLNEADLYLAQLKKTSLIKASACKSNFAGAFLDGAVLRDVDLTRANLRKAKLRGAYLVWTRLVHANLSNADLTGADLSEANLMYANLRGADLTNANLTNAIVTQAQLRKAKSISGAVLVGIRDRLAPPRMPESDEIWRRHSQRQKNTEESDGQIKGKILK